uniref:DNA cytosine methyltransferase n=1 Tax=Mitsuokella multacida TaxID=52226 RepID=UPI003FA1F771
KLYSRIYPETEMICGDITDELIYKRLVSRAKELHVDVVIATPPCQGFSRARRNQDENDIRNRLILSVIRMVKDVNPKYVFIENVPQIAESKIWIQDREIYITDYIKSQLGNRYCISVNFIDTKDYSVPQTRKRTIILLTRLDQSVVWSIPEPDLKYISLEDAIGDLPSVDPFVKDVDGDEFHRLFPDYEKKREAALKVSKWHVPPVHIERQVITMMHTPTGCTAFNNEKYFPVKADGTPVKGYLSTYRRLRWCDPASTVTMDNRKISSQNNVHPGRYIGKDENGDVLYSDPRALTLFELMRVMSLPDDWPLPDDANIAFVRAVIGEGIPPLFVKKVFLEVVR